MVCTTRSAVAREAALLAAEVQQIYPQPPDVESESISSRISGRVTRLRNSPREKKRLSSKVTGDLSPPQKKQRTKAKILKSSNLDELPHNLGSVTTSVSKAAATGRQSSRGARLRRKEEIKETQYLWPHTWRYSISYLAHPTPEECEEVNRLLSSLHGDIVPPTTIPEPSLTVTGCGEVPSVLDALIRTLLSGATTGKNSAMAFNGLVQRFGILEEGIGRGSVNWDAVRRASVKDVFEAIKRGGLADIKSKNLKAILDMVHEENQQRRNALGKGEDDRPSNLVDKQYEITCADPHVLSLNHLHSLGTDQVMTELVRFPGIGPKTAAWLNWVPPAKATEITAFSHLEVRIPDHLKYSLHQLFIRHGKSCPRCRAITGQTSAGWEDGCVIDHLVKRTGKRKVRAVKMDALLPLAELLRGHASTLGVSLLSFSAVFLGYLFVVSGREAAVPFTVPYPPEIGANWVGKKWEELQGEERKIIEGQIGGTKVDASFGEILVTAEKLKWTIDHGEKALAAESRPTNFLMMYKKNKVTYEPLGVVSACVSWNYPFHNFISPVISAIFAGNGIVVKPSEQTAWCTMFFLDIIRGALESCGHSGDLVHSVVCLPQVADVLTSHPEISQMTFIGSRPVAHKVCESAARALTPVTVELGGKDPAVILDDSRTVAQISSIASILMRGVFQSAGQNCIGVERVIAVSGAYNILLDAVSSRIKTLRLGSILLDAKPGKAGTPDVGAMISPASFDRLEHLIIEAVKQGARLICGGQRFNHPDHPLGHYFTPTLLADVTPSMQIAQTELFAPVFLMMRAESVSHAIEIANSTQYALGASVFGFNDRDVTACVKSIKAGMVAVNDFGSYYAVQLPFGGVKGSGYGRFAGEEGLRAVSNIKAICVDRFPKLVGTAIPPRVDYPIQKGETTKLDGTGAWEMCKGVVETGYQLTLAGRVNGILRLLKNM
ncbi:hypothetical protein AOCH_007185 [Aspergillus ochraceoroseus]|uniref:aldehyde dehydrogenase (NAD(+)) n=1 Tax=Aspergillus ochraceoroseus TaxID=138278 RepID=A0A0F8WSY2_9EURO|nr:hypothetical protein AOCH_007185 [Aspergillus ochraceoroseus]